MSESMNDDARNIRLVILIMGAALLLDLSLIGWLAYVLTLRAVGTSGAAELPAGLNQMLGGLVTIAGGLATGIGVLLARTSTTPPVQTNVVNAAPMGQPPGDTTNVTNVSPQPVQEPSIVQVDGLEQAAAEEPPDGD